MPDLKVGVHLSLGANPRASVEEAHAAGAACVQIFASSPGTWKPPLLLRTRVDSFLQGRVATGVGPAFIHAIYLINLASADRVLLHQPRTSLIATLRAAPELRVSGVVTHLGSHGGRGFEDVTEQVANELGAIVDSAPEGVDLIVENSAGAGGLLGSSLDELAELLHRAGNHPRIKIALDTAHLCAAGWDFNRDGTAGHLVEAVRESVGLDRLALIHCNDSKSPCGSRRDRHACIGEGHIGETGFLSLLAEPALTGVPWILETPDLDANLATEDRFRSLRALRRMAE